MNMEVWLEDKDKYQLNKSLHIVKAEKEEFSIYESIYGDEKYNRFAVKNWDLRLAISLDTPFARNDSFYWIFNKDTKIGGVLVEPNVISRIFFITPFQDFYKVIKLLKKLLIKWSNPDKNIYAFQISNEQRNYFEMLGFWKEKSRCWMIRPTEKMDYKLDLNLKIKKPKKEDSKEIAKLLNLSFENGVDENSQLNKSSRDKSLNNWLETVDNFFDNKNESLIEASIIVYDTNKKIIGVCLVSIFEKWPLIHTIAVDPLYSGKGIGRIMLKKGISILNKNYSVVRLFVTKGNPAEAMYYELGFVQGVEFSKYYLSKDNI